ncbi:MAG: hypothetical protein H6569_12580 [Lewinellaceae bacterium]|nr:hypothetical protein [Lewinellaceae bacterium]
MKPTAAGTALALPASNWISIFDGFFAPPQSRPTHHRRAEDREDRRYLADAKHWNTNWRVQFDGASQMLRTQEENVALARDITENLVLGTKKVWRTPPTCSTPKLALTEAETHYWQQVFNYKLAVLKLLKAAGYLQCCGRVSTSYSIVETQLWKGIFRL